MKIIFATFELKKYGGIVSHIESKFKAFKKLGHDVDIVIIDYTDKINTEGFEKKKKSLENGDFKKKINFKSQNGGYEKSNITGYWFNPYYGWLLEPGYNRIPCYHEKSLELWEERVKDVDLIIWSFIPTKGSGSKGLNFWHKFFDLPKRIKQIISIHDGYYNQRNTWTNLLKNKISFFECVHITGYNCCKVFDFPLLLNYDSRFIDKSLKSFKIKSERQVDYFAAHIFKSMKKIEDFVNAIHYLDEDEVKMIAGSGIELYYMTSPKKKKKSYVVSEKTDPDCNNEDIGMNLWDRAVRNKMEYLGLISNKEVDSILSNCRFAIDPSFSKQYSNYVNTHLNGFIIEAIINGAYPVLRNYRNDLVENDYIFQNLKAIYIPKDAKPIEFADKLREANKMSDEEFQRDIKHNFLLAKKILDPIKNMSNIIELVQNEEKINELEKGESTTELQLQGLKVMKEHFNYSKIPNWMID